MIGQDTFPSELKYCKDLIHALKTRQNVDSSRAILHLDTRTGVTPFRLEIPFAINESKLVRITYSHPGAPTPYAQMQFRFTLITNNSFINYVVYRDSFNLYDEYETNWILQLRNLGGVVTNLSLDLGVKSSAPGTLTAVTL